MVQPNSLVILISLMLTAALPVSAQDRQITLAAPSELVESGFLKFVLPRFSLKNSIRVQIVEGDAQAVLTTDGGRDVFSGNGQTYGLVIADETDFTARFADWITSEAGLRAIEGFKIDGAAVYGPPEAVEAEVAVLAFDGDAAEGETLSLLHCGRCHVVGERNRMAGIGSTPSFAVLRTFPDWEDRFTAFYVLRPHGAFTQITDVTPPFDPERPSPITPVELTLDELDNILAYVAEVMPADLGAPIQHQ